MGSPDLELLWESYCTTQTPMFLIQTASGPLKNNLSEVQSGVEIPKYKQCPPISLSISSMDKHRIRVLHVFKSLLIHNDLITSDTYLNPVLPTQLPAPGTRYGEWTL